MPRENVTRALFLKQIMAGEKQVLRKTQVVSYDVPKLPGLSIADMMPYAKKSEVFDDLMPDDFL